MTGRTHGWGQAGRRLAPALAVVMLFCASVPAVASATTALDQQSDHTALTAYRSYLNALINGAAQARTRDDALVTTVERVCPQALAPLNSLTADQVSTTALSDFGEEIGGDLAVDYLSDATTPFGRLAATLGGLRWSSRASSATVSGLLNAESSVLDLTPSHLCVDARAIARHPKTIPGTTAGFLSHYLRDSAALKRRLASVLALLAHFQTSGEHGLITTIDRLVNRFASISAAAQRADAHRILSDLGLSTSP